MKFPVLFMAVAGLVAACNQSPTNNENELSSSTNIDVSTQVDEEYSISNYQIRLESGNLWTRNWTAVCNDLVTNHELKLASVDSHNVSRADFDGLLNNCSSCDGVRIYFGASLNNDGVREPVLLLANMEMGNDISDTTVLLVSNEANNFIQPDAAYSYVGQWDSLFKSISFEMPAFIDVQAYNFSVADLRNALDEIPESTGLTFLYGVHTVGPDNPNYSITQSSSNCTNPKPIAGQLVINVLAKVNHPGSAHNDVECARLDYANPCPQHCGTHFYDHLRAE